jgi:isopentenyl diphosphate isomerase/L-lactate dehydrogenase-like FMN-dependent dehydrogenase
LARRNFLQFLAASPLLCSLGREGYSATSVEGQLSTGSVDAVSGATERADNLFHFESVAQAKLKAPVFAFINGGSEDQKTVRANREAFDHVQIRARRLVDVSSIDTSVRLFGQTLRSPLTLSPVGAMAVIHPEGELAVSRAATPGQFLLIASTVSSYSIAEIADSGKGPLWFQLYPTPDRGVTKALIQKAEATGCEVLVLAVDSPVVGNREVQKEFFDIYAQIDQSLKRGNFRDLDNPNIRAQDPTLSWEFIDWLRANSGMKIVLKGIVTREDASLCLKYGVDGLIVSNHGGRQEESGLGTLECLPEVVEAVGDRIPVMIDGGFRRGTDIFKALALGATAIGIGRPYLWGLGAYGQKGVESVLDILHGELVRAMQLSGTPSIRHVTPNFVRHRSF